MRITRLALTNWRNFKKVEVNLSQRSFFVGPNASGKSNFLDALRFLRDLVSVGGGLQDAVMRRGGVSELRALSANFKSNIILEFDLGDDDAPTQWGYKLEFKHQEKIQNPIIVKEIVFRNKTELFLNRPDNEDADDAARLTQTALEQTNANKSFRYISDFLVSIQYLHVIPQVIRDPGRSSGKDDPFGGDLIERINNTSKRTRDARLKKMEEALKIAVPQLSNLEIELERGVPHLRAKYKHWRPAGAWQRESRFSDGTLRLLGLIWSLQETGGPLLLEEPEISLNPAVVSQLAPMIARATRRSKRQSLITTHSADLISEGVALSEIHLLEPSDQGTKILSEPDLTQVHHLIEGGVPLGEAILPRTKAANLEALTTLDLISS